MDDRQELGWVSDAWVGELGSNPSPQSLTVGQYRFIMPHHTAFLVEVLANSLSLSGAAHVISPAKNS